MGLIYLPYPTKSTIHVVGKYTVRPSPMDPIGRKPQGEEGDVVLQNTLLNALGRSSQVAKVGLNGWRFRGGKCENVCVWGVTLPETNSK